MFLHKGAEACRARVISACRSLLALCVSATLALPCGPAFAAADSVFVHGTVAPGNGTPEQTIQTPSVQSPTVQTPTVASPTVAAPNVAAPRAVPPLAAPGVPAPSQAGRPQTPPVANAPGQPASPGVPTEPTVRTPQAPASPAKEKKSRSRKDKKTRKARKEEQDQREKKPDVEGAPPHRDRAPAAQKRSSPSQTEEAAVAYAKGDYARAESIWSRQAEAGDGQAMNNLGVLYDLGQGVEPDLGRALHWFAESAKTGHPSGMSNYGRMLEQGRGIEPNPEEAARWFDLAARQGQPEAQYNLGMLYELGRGVKKDDKAAAAWYSRAAAQQQTEALFRLGHFYRTGRGVAKNTSRAVLLLYAAAMNGNADAMKELEDMARAEPSRPEAVLFGQRLDNTDRNSMREALKRYGAKPTREDDGYICDLYEAAKVAPGARQMAICYGPGNPAPLGFLELDYAAPNNKVGAQILKMVTERFGPASAGEGDDAHLWNLGSVVVATRYEPTRSQLSLMYMVPKVYYLTRQR